MKNALVFLVGVLALVLVFAFQTSKPTTAKPPREVSATVRSIEVDEIEDSEYITICTKSNPDVCITVGKGNNGFFGAPYPPNLKVGDEVTFLVQDRNVTAVTR